LQQEIYQEQALLHQVAAAFTAFSNTIPNGYIWVDTDSSAGVGYYSATSIYTATAPTTNLSKWINLG
jgi:hypothetical protein